jgi:hypothetical protein
MRVFLYVLAAAMVAAGILFYLDRPGEEWAVPASSARDLARTLDLHPTDWRAASALSEHVLDEEYPHRIEAWRAAHALAAALAPHFEAPRVKYARAGLFHWLEISSSDRKQVLDAIQPLMRDPVTYARMAHPIFELTGDLNWLRHARPDDLASLRDLRDLAATYGRFQDYRELREEETRKSVADFESRAGKMEPSEIVQQLPAVPRKSDEAMLRTALEELHRRPLEVDPGRPDVLDAVIGYADRHGLRPLDGLSSVVTHKGWASDTARKRLALALGQPAAAEQIAATEVVTPRDSIAVSGVTWAGTCGTDICRSAEAEVDGPLRIELQPVLSDEVPPYVEIYIDDALVAEQPVPVRGTVAVVPAGHHRVEINLANRLTRNRGGRRVRID